jgi:hypothetical protein
MEFGHCQEPALTTCLNQLSFSQKQCSSQSYKHTTWLKTFLTTVGITMRIFALTLEQCLDTNMYDVSEIQAFLLYQYVNRMSLRNYAHIFIWTMDDRGSKAGAGFRDASRCQYIRTTNPGKCHLSVTVLSANHDPHVQVLTPVREGGWASSGLELEPFS